MAFGIKTGVKIIHFSIVLFVLATLFTIEYEILNATTFELIRQMNRYHDMNYF